MPPSPPNIVCVHGLGRSESDWDRVRPGLEAHGHVTTPDVSARLTGAVSMLDETTPAGAIVIGHSMGGLAALRFASQTTMPLRGLVLTNCAFPPSRNGRGVIPTAADYAAHRLAVLRELAAGRLGHSPRIEGAYALRSFAALALDRHGFAEMVRAISAPVLIIHARDDHYVPVQFAMAAAARRPDWTLHIEAVGGHRVHLLHPEAWLAAVAGWLAS